MVGCTFRKAACWAVVVVALMVLVGCSPSPAPAVGTAPVAAQPTLVTPQAELFIQDPQGCGDFFVYRFDASRTLAITVRVDERRLDFTKQPVLVHIQPGESVAAVNVLQFREVPHEYFCDDVLGDPPPIAEWTAVSGTILIERSADPPPDEFRNATHKISVLLKDIQLQNIKTGQSATISVLQLNNVWVGWLAG